MIKLNTTHLYRDGRARSSKVQFYKVVRCNVYTKKRVQVYSKRLFFHILIRDEEELRYPEDKYGLVIMDTFDGQDNCKIEKLC